MSGWRSPGCGSRYKESRLPRIQWDRSFFLPPLPPQLQPEVCSASVETQAEKKSIPEVEPNNQVDWSKGLLPVGVKFLIKIKLKKFGVVIKSETT